MDVSLCVNGYDVETTINLYLDKMSHQVSALSHLRAVAEMCVTSISCDPSEKESIKSLKSFDRDLKRMQRHAIKARKGRARMEPMPSVLSPGVEANHMDGSDGESEVEAIVQALNESIAPQHDSEDADGLAELPMETRPQSTSSRDSLDLAQEQVTSGDIFHAGKQEHLMGSPAAGEPHPCETGSEKLVDAAASAPNWPTTGAFASRAARSLDALKDSKDLVPSMEIGSREHADCVSQQSSESKPPLDAFMPNALAPRFQSHRSHMLLPPLCSNSDLALASSTAFPREPRSQNSGANSPRHVTSKAPGISMSDLVAANECAQTKTSSQSFRMDVPVGCSQTPASSAASGVAVKHDSQAPASSEFGATELDPMHMSPTSDSEAPSSAQASVFQSHAQDSRLFQEPIAPSSSRDARVPLLARLKFYRR
eukprot:TRINITY_DN5661_c0_g1_i2.p1 TRINITY_DN5661_c0_g1~~TRINITY_DN5661_c0_g1_i2.p1  ORF type:complete len:426 (+),score=58.67 TRINITY_DN5661_c0_g1_i2:80-1357(+)